MNKITMTWETISPATAAKYIESMDGNRPVRQSRVDYYAGQMKAGLWRETHQGIAFDSDAHMIDGQHRMWAIIESGTPVRILVSRGVSSDDVAAVDNGLSRDYQDIAHYAGWDTNPLGATLAKILVNGITTKATMTPPEICHQWYEHYKDAITFALDIRSHSRTSGRLLTVAMTAAFARAFYCIDNAMLTRMGEALRTGVVSGNVDRAALVLRDAWLTKRLGPLASEQYLKTESAIRAFSERRAITKLQSPEGELFTIPKLPRALQYDRVQARSTANKAKAEKLSAVNT